MNSKLIQIGSVAVIIISAIICGYILIANHQKSAGVQTGNLVSMVGGKQLMKMNVYSASYSPNYFKIKVGVPVRWEITSSGQPGCDSGAVVSSLLPGGSLYLNPNAGQVTVAEFTPQTVGKYTFACPMAMVLGSIEVVN